MLELLIVILMKIVMMEIPLSATVAIRHVLMKDHIILLLAAMVLWGRARNVSRPERRVAMCVVCALEQFRLHVEMEERQSPVKTAMTATLSPATAVPRAV